MMIRFHQTLNRLHDASSVNRTSWGSRTNTSRPKLQKRRRVNKDGQVSWQFSSLQLIGSPSITAVGLRPSRIYFFPSACRSSTLTAAVEAALFFALHLFTFHFRNFSSKSLLTFVWFLSSAWKSHHSAIPSSRWRYDDLLAITIIKLCTNTWLSIPVIFD